MVERTTDPNQLVAVHGIGRQPDGDTIPQPPRPEHPDNGLRATVLACAAVIVLVLLVAGILR